MIKSIIKHLKYKQKSNRSKTTKKFKASNWCVSLIFVTSWRTPYPTFKLYQQPVSSKIYIWTNMKIKNNFWPKVFSTLGSDAQSTLISSFFTLLTSPFYLQSEPEQVRALLLSTAGLHSVIVLLGYCFEKYFWLPTA